jgi:hypothetical protein
VSAIFILSGLEVAFVDHSATLLESIEQGEPEAAIAIEVAGPAALLVSKGSEIGERYEAGEKAFAEVTNDVADVYRLHGIYPSRSCARALPACSRIVF